MKGKSWGRARKGKQGGADFSKGRDEVWLYNPLFHTRPIIPSHYANLEVYLFFISSRGDFGKVFRLIVFLAGKFCQKPIIKSNYFLKNEVYLEGFDHQM